MVEPESALEPVYRRGLHGNISAGIAIVFQELRPGSIVEVASWPGENAAILKAIETATDIKLKDASGAGATTENNAAFNIAPGRYLVVSQAEGLTDKLAKTIRTSAGTQTDLSHGRTAIAISGHKSEWLLAKFFAVDFSLQNLPVESGLSTVHHDVFAAIQRTKADQFDLYVYRSFARSFFSALCHAAEQDGYEIR